jgi:hypothetical protein
MHLLDTDKQEIYKRHDLPIIPVEPCIIAYKGVCLGEGFKEQVIQRLHSMDRDDANTMATGLLWDGERGLAFLMASHRPCPIAVIFTPEQLSDAVAYIEDLMSSGNYPETVFQAIAAIPNAVAMAGLSASCV